MFQSMNRVGMRLKQRGRGRGRRREEGIGSCRDSVEWRHTPLGAAGMHPFVLAACRLGCKQWRKSCIVAVRIVSRKAVTLSSGSCALPLPTLNPLPSPLAGSKGGRALQSLPRIRMYLQRKQIVKFRLPSIIFRKGWLGFLPLPLAH